MKRCHRQQNTWDASGIAAERAPDASARSPQEVGVAPCSSSTAAMARSRTISIFRGKSRKQKENFPRPKQTAFWRMRADIGTGTLLVVSTLLVGSLGDATTTTASKATVSSDTVSSSDLQRAVQQELRRILQESAEAPRENWWQHVESGWEKTKEGFASTVSAPITAFVHHTINPAFQWISENWTQPTANILYTLGMLYLFATLPQGVALVVGFFTVFIGPAMLEGLLELLWLVVETAATEPVYIVLTVWVCLFFNSAILRVHIAPRIGGLLQRCAMCVGMDADGTGAVDWLDVLYFLQHGNPPGRWITENVTSKLFEGDPHAYFTMRREQKAMGVEVRLERMEATLDLIAEHLDIKPAYVPLARKAKPSAAPSGAEPEPEAPSA